jgi:protein involved in polysaccharide export with SLBB domain
MNKGLFFMSLILAVGMFSSPLCAQGNKEEAMAHYIKGNEHYVRGSYPEAEKEFEAALKLLTKNAEGESSAVPSPEAFGEARPAGEYLLDQDDFLLVSAWQNPLSAAGGEYIIEKDDTLAISVWQNPDLNQEATVRPDGKISFPLVGDIDAKGLTIPQLRQQITQMLKEYVRYPDVTITIKKLGGVKELAQEVVVRPDGKISFPMAGDIQAKGLTIAQLRQSLKESLKTSMRYPDASVIIKKLGGTKVIVLGEVKSPGVYSLTGAKTILEAIGLAEGFTRDSVPSSTILIRGTFADKPQAQRINLSKALKGDLSENIPLLSEDVVFIPKKFIADLNYFLTQVLDPIAKGAYTAEQFQSW